MRKSKGYASLVKRLRRCRNCECYLHRRKVVPGRGDVPATILFIGIAPGKTEDLLGKPFVGYSGWLLEAMMEHACRLAEIEKVPSYFILNSVLCRAWNWDEDNELTYGKNRNPTKEEVLACMPNIQDTVSLVKPKFVIFLGRHPEKFYKNYFREYRYVTHPASMLRDGGKQSPDYLPNVRILSEIFEELSNG